MRVRVRVRVRRLPAIAGAWQRNRMAAHRAASGRSSAGRLAAALARLLAIACLLSSPAFAAHSTATLVAATDGWSPGRPLRLGLALSLASGWHTYWSNPGDAGLAPDATVSIDGGKPVPVAFRYPAPQRIPADGLMGYGYSGDVLLPFGIDPSRAGAAGDAPLDLRVHADWLVCAAVCVPQSADLSLTLPPSAMPDASAQAAAFARADAAMPREVPLDARFSPDGRLRVTADFLTPATVRDAWFIPDAPGVIDQLAKQDPVTGAHTLSLRLRFVGGHPPATLSGVLAIVDRAGQETDLALDARPAAAGSPVEPPPPAASRGWPGLLALALLGGLVLNLMPCVFPILAMKALAMVRHGRGEQAALRRSALLYTAGVVGSFVLVGATLLVLRGLGGVVGWGFQFQSPAFVVLMGWLLFAVGLNLIGALEIGGRFAGVGQGLVARGGAFGDVMTGVLAVVVATPCTAPFMSVAVAGALAGSRIEGLAIFACLGLGLALPSLVLGLAPGAARLLPRPGPWMVRFRQALAFPMFGAAVWLLWVATVEAGAHGTLVFAAGVVLIGFAAWARELASGFLRGTARTFVASVALASVLVAVSLPIGLARVAPRVPDASNGIEAYSGPRLDRLRAGGTPVFVDMSAAWCVSCLVNERVALDTATVRQRFRTAGIVQMRGDWTGQDPAVTGFLRRFGREGVPLYVYFPPQQAAPRVLPQILTPSVVLDAVAG